MEAQQPGDRADRKGTRIGRGARMTGASWRLTRRDRTLLLLAMLAGVCSVAALGAVFVVFRRSSHGHLVAAALVASYPLTFLTVFFDVAIAAAAGTGLEGVRMGVGEALRSAHQRGDRIALWAVVAVAARFLLGLAGGPLGLAVGPLDLLWVLATIFVVPILALEDVALREALHGSRSLLRRGWREGLTGVVAIGVFTTLMVLPFFALLLVGAASVVLTSSSGGLIVASVGLLGLVAARGVAGAIKQVFAVALYRYAVGTSD